MYAAALEADYLVEVAYDGDEAIDRIDETFDVALLDRNMPGASGDDVVAYVREHSLDVRLAMVTGVTPDFDIVELGFDDYVCKPVERDALVDLVAGLLDRQAYDESLDRLAALRKKEALLRAEKTRGELAAHDGFQALLAEVDDLEAETRSQAAELSRTDVEMVYRNLDEATGDDLASDGSGGEDGG
jgi:DNA-binding response OmpR family regulator